MDSFEIAKCRAVSPSSSRALISDFSNTILNKWIGIFGHWIAKWSGVRFLLFFTSTSTSLCLSSSSTAVMDSFEIAKCRAVSPSSSRALISDFSNTILNKWIGIFGHWIAKWSGVRFLLFFTSTSTSLCLSSSSTAVLDSFIIAKCRAVSPSSSRALISDFSNTILNKWIGIFGHWIAKWSGVRFLLFFTSTSTSLCLSSSSTAFMDSLTIA